MGDLLEDRGLPREPLRLWQVSIQDPSGEEHSDEIVVRATTVAEVVGLARRSAASVFGYGGESHVLNCTAYPLLDRPRGGQLPEDPDQDAYDFDIDLAELEHE
jgi:hypothetical protein